MIAILIQTLISSPAREKLLYLDPGSGSFILQLVLAALLGAAVIARTYWGKIVGFFRKGGTETKEDDDE